MLPTLLIFSVLLLLALLPTLYVRYVLCKQWTSRWRPICWLPFALIAAVLILMIWFVYSTAFLRLFTFIVMCVIFPAIVFTVVSGIGWLLARKWPKAFRWVNLSAYVLCAAAFLMMLYGVCFGWKQLTVKHVDLQFENLPESFEGYRIVQLTDMHVGAYGTNTAFVERVVERTNALQPDMIVFTGDLVNLSANEIAPFVSVLSRLKAPDGVYSVLGNHDYCQYGFDKSKEQQVAELNRVKETEIAMGWNLLEDTHRIVYRASDSLAIAGVGNISKPPYIHAGDLDKAMTGLSDSVFTILLSHDPTHWRMEVLEQSAVDLTLSGHTHAGQVKVGSWSPAAMSYKEWSGLYEEKGRYLYVSEGLGGTFPFRLGATPQIIEITLHRK